MKKLFYFSLIILIVVLVIPFLTNKNTPNFTNNSIINTFLPINGSYSLGLGESTPLNFTYIYSDAVEDQFKKIDSILINNSNSINVQTFSIKGDGHLGGYHIKTLVITI